MAAVATGWAVVALAAGQAALGRQRRLERDTRARLVEERLRIARELHDVLSHSLASISMQAGVGLHLLDERPSQAETALKAIRDISNEALGQARSALSVIRDPDHPGATPSVADLDQLAASVRTAGTPVEMSVDLEEDGLPGAVDGAVYRIVQEALTNVMRHAGESAAATVRVHTSQGQVVVEVNDDGDGADESGRGGHGLSGMRERAQALGGQLDAGKGEGGGWKLRAVLPLRRG
jgi:signal transduction histidine kinase